VRKRAPEGRSLLKGDGHARFSTPPRIVRFSRGSRSDDLPHPGFDAEEAKRLRRVLIRLGLMLAGVAVAAGALEVAARALHMGSGAFWEPHPLYGWRNIPGAKGWESCYGECAVRVEINSKGLRDREIPYAKPAGTTRVLVLGDSLTAAMQVPLDDTFAKVAERRLGAPGRAVEVVNGGVNAFGTDNAYLFYRHEAHRYAPDVVVLAVYLANDVYNNSRALETRLGGQGHKPYFTVDEGGRLEIHQFPVFERPSPTSRFGSFLKKHFQLPRFLAQVMRLRSGVPSVARPLIELLNGSRGAQAAGGEATGATDGETRGAASGAAEGTLAAGSTATGVPRPPAPADDICAERYTPVVEDAWRVTFALIRQLKDDVRRDGARLAVVMIPASPQMAPLGTAASGEPVWYCEKPNRLLAEHLDREGIPFLDLLAPMRDLSRRSGARLYYERDFHMTVEGNRVAGMLLARFLSGTMLGGVEPHARP